MNKKRKLALKRLRESLTESQIADLKIVIETAEFQGRYEFNGEVNIDYPDMDAILSRLSSQLDDRK